MGRREKKRLAVRQALLDAGRNVIEQVGFKAATVHQIADIADVSLGTFFNYMESKERLLREIIADQFDKQLPPENEAVEASEIAGILPRDMDAELHAVMNARSLLQLGLLHAGAFSPLDLQSPTIQNAERRRRRTLRIASLQKLGKVRDDIPAEMISRHYDLLTGAAIAEWLLGNDMEFAPLKTRYEQALSIFLRGIESPAD